MRISSQSMIRNYVSGLNRNQAMLNKYSEQVYGQRFNKMFEDPASGIRALQVRRNLTRLETNISTVKDSKALYDAADATLQQVSKLTQSVSERFIMGMNGATGTDVDRQAIATELKALQQEIFSLQNGKFSNQHMFGGTNTGNSPWTQVDDGTGNMVLHYNGIDVSTLTEAQVDGFNTAYVNIGLGLSMNGQEVDETTAFPITFNGAKIFGYGDDNIYNIIGEMITMLESNSFDATDAGDLLERFYSANSNVTNALTEIGAQQQYLEATLDRLETDRLTLTERQQDLMFKDPTLAILDFTMQDYVYNAALQMGQRLLQPTLFSFIS